MNEIKIEYFGNKEMWVTYTNPKGNTMRLYGTYRKDNSDEYCEFVSVKLINQIKNSQFYQAS